jgi:DNA adenine methylase
MVRSLHKVIRPPLKWVGGKTQLLDELFERIPKSFGTYIEPFFGGGALFFALQPKKAVIADSNPELINFYNQLVLSVDQVIAELKTLENTEKCFYQVRALDWSTLSPSLAAARTLYLNRTCFNGLYRVNKKGQFNVPYGKYKKPHFFERENLLRAAELLAKARIVLGDYKTVLQQHVNESDLIFLDPPYLPISENSDFKRYTKEQFYLNDHEELAQEVRKLEEKHCHVILTNSNHPVVREQYAGYKVDVIQTKRHISCRGTTRTGEDIIVTVSPSEVFRINLILPVPEQVQNFPPTRFMGSKAKLLPEILAVTSQMKFKQVIDLFAGSGVVSYFFKCCGKQVYSNDYMAMSTALTKAVIENNSVCLLPHETERLLSGKAEDSFVADTFKGIYFSDEDNQLIDILRTTTGRMRNEYKKAIALSALIRACVKKRPRGIFTYVGERYNDGRKDLTLSLADHFRLAVKAINNAVFDNGLANSSRMGDAMSFENNTPGLVYIDPPYYSPFSDNEYVRRYHFVEGLARNWEGVEIQTNTVTKKFKSYPTPFSSKSGSSEAFEKLFEKFQRHILVVSYSSNSLPTQAEILDLLRKYKKKVRVFPIDYKYSFGNQGHKVDDNRNSVQEYLFVGE